MDSGQTLAHSRLRVNDLEPMTPPSGTSNLLALCGLGTCQRLDAAAHALGPELMFVQEDGGLRVYEMRADAGGQIDPASVLPFVTVVGVSLDGDPLLS